VVEPGRLKKSNLGRYLMSTYQQVHDATHKLDSIAQFMNQHAATVDLVRHDAFWRDVQRSWDFVICAVDTPEARREVQRSTPVQIVEAGVSATLYSLLRVVPDGWCLDCKFPPDPKTSLKRRSRLWGVPIGESFVSKRRGLWSRIETSSVSLPFKRDQPMIFLDSWAFRSTGCRA
jgi:hypothetical protein